MLIGRHRVILSPTMTGYSFRLGGGIGIGLIWLWFAAPQFHIKRSHLIKSVWVLSLFTLAAGRLGYVLMHIEYFCQNPVHLLQLHRVGGVHGESALIGGLIAIGIWTVYRHRGHKISDIIEYDSAQSFSESF